MEAEAQLPHAWGMPEERLGFSSGHTRTKDIYTTKVIRQRLSLGLLRWEAATDTDMGAGKYSCMLLFIYNYVSKLERTQSDSGLLGSSSKEQMFCPKSCLSERLSVFNWVLILYLTPIPHSNGLAWNVYLKKCILYLCVLLPLVYRQTCPTRAVAITLYTLFDKLAHQ